MKPHHLSAILLAGCIAAAARAQTAPPNAPEQKREFYVPADQDATAGDQKPEAQDYTPVKVEPKTLPKELVPYVVVPHHMTKAAWLGVSASPPSPVLRRQLKLPEGTGLVVDFVQPKSPAEEIGLKQYDLLIKLDDQLLINSEQLAVLVRLHKPGSDIELTVMREGERQTLSGKLAEHEVPELQFEFQPINPNMNFDIESGAKPGHVQITPPSTDMKLWLQRGSGSASDVEHSLTWVDGAKQVTLKMSNDNKRLMILDRPSGKIMFEGTIKSLEQATGLPDEARDALKRLRTFIAVHPDAVDGAKSPKDPTSQEPQERPR